MLKMRRLRLIRWNPLMRFCSMELVHKDSIIEKLRKRYDQDEKSNVVVPVFKKAMLFPDEVAVKDFSGELSFLQIFITAKKLSIQISNICGSASSSHVVFLCPNNALWVIVQWGCWISGQVVVPLDPNYTLNELRRHVSDCKPKLIISSPDYESTVQDLVQIVDAGSIILDHAFVPPLETVSSTSFYAKQLVGANNALLTESTLPNEFYDNARAMLLYTPGCNTGQKAVVLTHRNIEAQMRCLVCAWQLSAEDCLLPIVSMNRMHAMFGALLSVGGNLVLQQNFDCHTTWSALLGINSPSKQRVNLFMAMPIIYKRLIAEYDKIFGPDTRMVEYIMNHCKAKIRLMATGYGLLADPVFNRWRAITGQTICEYYGMLETGLALGQQLSEISASNGDHKPGALGKPLIGVTARLVDDHGKALVTCTNETGDVCVEHAASALDDLADSPAVTMAIGELQISGASVCSQYLSDNPIDVLKDGFFRTNDIFAYQNEHFYFLSKACDVFTVGGYKIYGSDIKKVLITHPSIKDVAVLGIPNKLWGHRLGVICIISSDSELDLAALKKFCNNQLPTHKRPTVFKTIISK